MKDHENLLFSLFQIGICIQHINKSTEKRLGLSLVQWCLLKRLIDLPATSANSLAKAVGVHPSTLTQTLKRLEKRKLIFITADPKDSRKKLISLTRFGKNRLESTSPTMTTWSMNLSPLSKELLCINSFLKLQIGKKSE